MEIKTARKEEAEAQAEYEKQRGELTKTLDAQTKTENTLNGEQADLSGKIADTEGEIANHEEMKLNTIDEKEAMKPSCDWVKEHFESRRTKRKTEIRLAGGEVNSCRCWIFSRIFPSDQEVRLMG